MNKYYPVFMKLENKKCVVIGGGKVAERKVKLLLESDALIEVISPDLTKPLEKILGKGNIKYIKGKYKKRYLKGACLVIAATDSPGVNNRIYNDCRGMDIKVNVIDAPHLCDFIIPSALKRGSLVITVSTGGKCPALAKKIRHDIEEKYGEEYEEFIELMGKLRDRLKEEIPEESNRRKFWKNLLSYDIPGLLKENREEEIKEIIAKCRSCFQE